MALDEETLARLQDLEDEVERITSKHPRMRRIARVPAGGTLADVIRTLNALIDRIQDEE